MKKYGFLLFLSACFLVLPFILIGQEKNPNDIMETLINQNQIFELNSQYPLHKEKLNPALRVLSEAVLANAYNQTDSALRAIENIKTHHWNLSFEQKMNVIILQSKLLLKRGDYPEAYQLLEEQLNNPTVLQYATESLLHSLKIALKQAEALVGCPKSSIERPQMDCIVPLVEGNKIPAQINGKEALFIFDTGADAPAFISRAFAEKHQIKVFEQTIPTGGIVATGETHIGFIDRLQIGNMVYRNFWTLVSPDDEISYHDTLISKADAVLGRHFMDVVGEIQILSTENKVLFPFHPSISEKDKNIILQNGQPYIMVSLNEEKTPLHLDTGGGIALYASYYQKNKEWIEKEGIKDSLGMAGFGGAKRYPIRIIPFMELIIADVPTVMEEVPVFINAQGFSKESDGMIGMDILSRFYKVVLNFKEMYFAIERL